MAADSGFTDPDDDEDSALRPAWEDTEDETDADRLRHRARAAPVRDPPQQRSRRLAPRRRSARAARPALCCDRRARPARRALPRPHLTAVRDGLIARMAFAEAAGWLAHAHAWVHPLDLALRDARAHRSHGAGRGRCRSPRPAADLRRPRRASRLGRSAVRGDGRG